MNIDCNALHGCHREGFDADLYLSDENSLFYVQGIQDQGAVTTAKDYICNEQGTNCFYGSAHGISRPRASNSKGDSVNLNDKTMHEIYLWPFTATVAVGIRWIMCSYKQMNGFQACQNEKTLNGPLKVELGFPDNVMSDWSARKIGVDSAIGGLHIEMPDGNGHLGNSLLQFIQSGAITEARANDMLVRVLALSY